MAIPKAAVTAIVKQVAAELNLEVEVRETGHLLFDGIYVKDGKGLHVQFLRHASGTIGVGWDENFINGPESETQQEFKQRALTILKDLM